jgi:signal transduction histidine kinase
LKWPLVTLPIAREDDVVAVRQRVRALAERLGFSRQEQTRLATAVSEIARNAHGHGGGGRAELGVGGEGGQSFVMRIVDGGPGIADLEAVLAGRIRSSSGTGLGLVGARRLVDAFEVESRPGRGTAVTMARRLPAGRAPLTGPAAAALAGGLSAGPDDPSALLREQNRELLQSLAALAEKEEEAQRLNRELAETNRGVVALYAELEAAAEKLRAAQTGLEVQVQERTRELTERTQELTLRTAELARANARLESEAVERERIEQELRQSQKMEAVGQLTGGIAHDFNNLLTGIIGSLDLMQRRIERGQLDTIDRYVKAAVSSANRAAALTHRLLAFARRQPLDPRPVSAARLVAEMEDMIRRTISESIELRIEAAPDLWTTLCDPHQLENAVLNLVINARDAMPDGGRLTVRSANARLDERDPRRDPAAAPGDFVTVSVSDTGTGMTPDVIAKAFEPFFTTKPLGQGTGLGLSMIYGFTRQSDGFARIESRLGHGTTVTLYLPRYEGEAGPEAATAAAAASPRAERGETVLVVEDDAVVRDLIVEVLREQGFRTLEAPDGPVGLAILQSPARVDLVVTDVGLPGLNGRQMIDQARARRPGLKVLFMTGYAENALFGGALVDAGIQMMTKPFPVEAFSARVREMLEI